MASGAANLFQVLPPIIAGSAASQVFTVTSNTSNPNGWTELHWEITPPTGAVVIVSLTPGSNMVVTGSAAPWAATITAPYTEANSLAMLGDETTDFVKCTYRLRYVGSSAADRDDIERGTVEVFA